MGSGGSSGRSGGSLSGGKTILTGTFRAEQTHTAKHGGPASYTLVSRSASDRRHRVQAAHDDRGDRLRKSRAEKGGTQCTKLSALEQIDHLLMPNEDEVVLRPKTPLVPPSPRIKAGLARERATTAAADYAGNSAAANALAAHQASSTVESARPDNPPRQSIPDEGGGQMMELEEEASSDKHAILPPAVLPLQPGPPLADRSAALKTSQRKVQTRGRKVPLQQRGPPVAPAVLTDIFHEAVLQTSPRNASITGMAPTGDACSSSAPIRAGQCSLRPVSQPARSPDDVSKVFGRLYIAHKPWVAGRTDSQLLQYLAWRGGTPEMASPPSSRSAPPTATFSDAMGSSFSGPSFLSSTSRSHRRQYRSHRELFDNCLRRDASPSPPPTDESRRLSHDDIENRSSKGRYSKSGSRPIYSPLRLAKAQVARQQSAKLIDQIEEIDVIPLDAVDSFLEAEMRSSPSSNSEPRLRAISS